MATFGNTAAYEGSYASDWHDWKIVFKYALSELADVTKLTVRVTNQGTGHAACNIMGIIYDDDGASAYPATLMGVSGAVALDDNAASAAVDLTFATAVRLPAGDWCLGIIGDTNAVGVQIGLTTGVTCPEYENADTYSGGPSDPFGACDYDAAFNQGCIYATYTPVTNTLSVAATLGAITSAATIANVPPARTISSVAGTLASGRTNHCKNPMPIHTANLIPGQWSQGNASNSVYTYSDGGVYEGITSKHINIAGGAGCSLAAGVYIKQPVNSECTAGEIWTVSADFGEAAFTGCSIRFIVGWQKNDGTSVGGTWGAAMAPGAAFARYSSGPLIAPALAGKLLVGLWAYNDFHSGDIQDYSICKILIEKAASAGEYFDGSTATPGVPHAWTGTAHASTSTEGVGLGMAATLANLPPHIISEVAGTLGQLEFSADLTNLLILTEGVEYTLSWEAVAGTITYECDFSALGDFTDAVALFTGESGTTYAWTPAYDLVHADTTTCRLRVRARNELDEVSAWAISEAFKLIDDTSVNRSISVAATLGTLESAATLVNIPPPRVIALSATLSVLESSATMANVPPPRSMTVTPTLSPIESAIAMLNVPPPRTITSLDAILGVIECNALMLNVPPPRILTLEATLGAVESGSTVMVKFRQSTLIGRAIFCGLTADAKLGILTSEAKL
jgi:hypothetical protein